MTFETFYNAMCKEHNFNLKVYSPTMKDLFQQAFAAGGDYDKELKKYTRDPCPHRTQAINVIDRDGNKVFFSTIKSAADWCGVMPRAIFKALKENRFTKNGYKFERLTKC